MHHRKLDAWKFARQNSLAVHRFVGTYWTPSRATVCDQLRRAALSVHLNIAEGCASGPGKRCRYHLQIALGSAVETTELLEMVTALGGDVREMLSIARRVQRMTNRLWKASLRNK